MATITLAEVWEILDEYLQDEQLALHDFTVDMAMAQYGFARRKTAARLDALVEQGILLKRSVKRRSVYSLVGEAQELDELCHQAHQP